MNRHSPRIVHNPRPMDNPGSNRLYKEPSIWRTPIGIGAILVIITTIVTIIGVYV